MNSNQLKKISIIIPAYNEAKRIKSTINDITSYFEKVGTQYNYELLVVDDGSQDQTVDIISELSQSIPQLQLIQSKKNKGKGHAVKLGMKQATGDISLFMDADNSVPIDYLPSFLEKLQNGYDVAVASIRVDGANAHESKLYRKIMSKLSQLVIKTIAQPPVEDTQRGFKIFTRRAVEIIFSRQRIDGFAFDIELLTIAKRHNLAVSEIPVIWKNPEGSTVKPSAYFSTLRELIHIVHNDSSNKYH